MIALLYNLKDAEKLSKDIDDFLKKNRGKYKALKWSDINKSDNAEKWCVKIPSDIENYKNKLDFEELELVEKLPDNWKTQTNI